MAERIRRRIGALTVPTGTELVTITVSCGATLFDTTVTEAMDQADQALYRAKIEGRNRTVVFGKLSRLTTDPRATDE